MAVPETLRTLSGITWRVLVVIAGLAFAGLRARHRSCPVAFALFFAMLMTAWAQPLMNVFHGSCPRCSSMVLALLVIGVGVIVILGTVIRSTIQEGPKLVESLTGGFSRHRDLAQDRPAPAQRRQHHQPDDRGPGLGQDHRRRTAR